MRDLLIKQQKCFFVVIAEEAVDDERLSPRDLGILVKLLRLPNNWDFSIKGLISIIKNIGECSIRKSLQNLEKYGYLTREILRDCSGKICGRNWIVRDYVPNCAKNENVESFQQNLSSRGGYSMQKAPENVESKINVFQHGSELTTKNEPKSAETRNLKPFSPGSIFYTRGGKGSVMPKHEAAISENPQSQAILTRCIKNHTWQNKDKIKYNINKNILNKNIYLSDEKIPSNINLFFNKMTSSKLTTQKPSTFDEVCEYFERAGLKTDPKRFYSYYQSTNWEGIKNWKIAARRWVDYPQRPAQPIGRSFKTSSYKPLNTASTGYAKPHMADLSYGTSYNNYADVLPDVSAYY